MRTSYPPRDLRDLITESAIWNESDPTIITKTWENSIIAKRLQEAHMTLSLMRNEDFAVSIIEADATTINLTKAPQTHR